MKTPAPRNLAASVSQRLLERSRRDGEDHQYLLMRYGLERLMYRLGQSPHADLFVLKGAMMFLVWSGSPYRPTKDLDLLAVKSSSVEHLAEIFCEICLAKVPDDALNFLPATVAAEAIREDAAYQGVRQFFLALKHSPVPGLLVFDQPSQVYFPKRLAVRPGEEEETDPQFTDDEDVAAVQKAFRVMTEVVNESKSHLQIIVLDHAPQTVWGSVIGMHLVEEWRNGRKLVPVEWLKI